MSLGTLFGEDDSFFVLPNLMFLLNYDANNSRVQKNQEDKEEEDDDNADKDSGDDDARSPKTPKKKHNKNKRFVRDYPHRLEALAKLGVVWENYHENRWEHHGWG